MAKGRTTWLSLEGQKFTRLLVEREAERIGKYIRQWHCICDCGERVVARQGNLISRNTKSCGCLDREKARANLMPFVKTVHKHTKRVEGKPPRSRTYISWQSMKSRCYAPKTSGFHNWGGKGIKVCDEWINDFAAFLRDMGERPEGKTLDRVDPHGDYTPQNCRWATPKEQAEQVVRAKLSREQVDFIRTNPRIKARELAARFGVAKGTVKNVRRDGRNGIQRKYKSRNGEI